MKEWEITQESRTANGFNRKPILEYLTQISQADFDTFCQKYLHLLHYYDSSKHSYCTDVRAFFDQHPDQFWELIPFDTTKAEGAEP